MHEIQLAMQYFQNGNIATAEKFLLSGIKKNPKNVDILHLLGLIKIQQKAFIEAKQYLELALAVDGNDLTVLFNYSNLLVDLHENKRAIEGYEKCLGIDQNNPAIWQGLGVALRGTKELVKALSAFEKSIKLDPSNHLFLINMASVLSDLGRDIEALSILNKSLNIQKSTTALKNKIAILIKLNRFDEAEKSVLSAMLLDDKNISILLLCAEVFSLRKEYSKSEIYFYKVLNLDQNNIESKRGLAIALAEQGKLNDAYLIAKSILQMHSPNSNDWMTLGIICKDLGNMNESALALEQSIRLDPMIPEAHYNLGHVYLEQCQFRNGWQKYEYRWQCKGFGSNEFRSDRPKWNGVDFNGTLLVWPEQGIGDQILYASFIDVAKDRVRKLIVALDQRLISIFEQSHPSVTFISKDEIPQSLIFDWHISIGSFIAFVCTSQEDFKNRTFPYIKPSLNYDSANKFPIQLDQKKKLVGLSWLSINAKHSNSKSLLLKQLLSILKIDNLQFLDIGYVDGEEQRKDIYENSNILVHKVSDIDSFNDINSLTALIAKTDFVITTSNTCAHIAGALGKKVYLLLPCHQGRFWYWCSNNGQSIWYPSISIFKQSEDNGWEATVESLRLKILQDWT